MYKHFFGLRENPFNVNPDPRYLFLTSRMQGALTELTYGVQARRGLILLTGEAGTGKTTLINRLLDWLHQEEMPTAFIFNPHLKSGNLLDLILADFDVPPDPAPKTTALMHLNQWLIERFRAGKTPVLIVDEAQGLPTPVLEEIRMLLNLETPREKLLQIVLAGQPELEARLKRPELRQIKQRITLHCRTAPLTREETHEYIQTRLNMAGASDNPIFDSQAMDAVSFYSRGIPRVMNLLCENALVNAFVNRVQSVPEEIVLQVARELQFDDIKPLSVPFDPAHVFHSSPIAPLSMLKGIMAPVTDGIESHGKENSRPASTRISIPFLVPETVQTPVEPSVAPLLNNEINPHPTEDAKVSVASSDRLPMPDARGPRRRWASPPLKWTEFISNVGAQFFSGLAKRPALLTLLRLFDMVGARIQFALLPAFKRLTLSIHLEFSHLLGKAQRSNLTRIIASRLERSLQQFQAWYQRRNLGRSGPMAALGSLNLSRMKASAYRWLRKPWNPNPLRWADSLLFDERRGSHKKM